MIDSQITLIQLSSSTHWLNLCFTAVTVHWRRLSANNTAFYTHNAVLNSTQVVYMHGPL